MDATIHTAPDPPAVEGAKPAQPPALAQKARLALFWTGGFQIFWDLLQFGVMLALVRLLPADAYGQFGFVSTLVGFLTLYSFREMLGHTLIVRDEAGVRYQAHFTAGAVIQLAMCAIANLLAFALRWMPDYAPAAPALHLMSIIFLLDLPSELRVKMLERLLDWRRLRLLHALGLVLSAALSIALALSGWGVLALIVPLFLVPMPFIYDLFVREGWRPTWQWSWAAYRPAWRFGSARMLAVSFVTGAGLLESSWLVRTMGFAAFGIFGRAVGLAQRSCQRIGGIVATSVYPVLTRVETGSDQYRRASALFLRSVAWVVVPIACATSVLAGDVVSLLYGGRWLGVVPLLPWAMFGGALAAVVHTSYTLLLAHQRQDRCLRADVWRCVGTVVMLAAALPFGVRGYLAGLVVVHAVSLALVLRWLSADRAVTPAGVRDALLPACVAGGGASAVLIGLRAYGGEQATGLLPMLALGALFAGLYMLILRLVFRSQLQDLVAYLPERDRLHRWLRLQEAA
jgi:O-antigen/teichoic acid export membrane protein